MDDIGKLSEIFKALSDPTRLKIIKMLNGNKNSYCVNALTSRLLVTQSAVSQHLRVLRHADLVISKRIGFHVHYSINKETLESFKSQIVSILGENFIIKQ